MARLAVDALPVVDSGRVVGVLTAADLRRCTTGRPAEATGSYA
jgi:CBS domain-containing protein